MFEENWNIAKRRYSVLWGSQMFIAKILKLQRFLWLISFLGHSKYRMGATVAHWEVVDIDGARAVIWWSCSFITTNLLGHFIARTVTFRLKLVKQISQIDTHCIQIANHTLVSTLRPLKICIWYHFAELWICYLFFVCPAWYIHFL